MQNKPRVLFIIKKRVIYSDNYSAQAISSGLVNSATFVSNMLNENDIESKVIQVIDNNCIDREVRTYGPDIVFIEAMWVVPEKFEILHKLHPKVKWVIRIHSETPFMANEGMAIDWLFAYAKQKN